MKNMMAAIHEIENRLAVCMSQQHNSSEWYTEGKDYLPTRQTFMNWIETAIQDARSAAAVIEDLRQEIEYLRHYGNKDCTAQADEAMANDPMFTPQAKRKRE